MTSRGVLMTHCSCLLLLISLRADPPKEDQMLLLRLFSVSSYRLAPQRGVALHRRIWVQLAHESVSSMLFAMAHRP